MFSNHVKQESKVRKTTSWLGTKCLACVPLSERKPPAQKNVVLETDFENAFNATNRYFMLEKPFEIHREVYEYPAYCIRFGVMSITLGVQSFKHPLSQ